MLNDEIIAAYRATKYRVHSNPEFTLRVDEQSEELLKLYGLSRASSAALITAWNPFSEEKSPSENNQKNALLRADLETFGRGNSSRFWRMARRSNQGRRQLFSNRNFRK